MEHTDKTRRVHDAEFKAKVVAQCKAAGASVAAVAQANGVDASVVRRWLNGQGLKRCAGLSPAAGGRAGQAAAQSAAEAASLPATTTARGIGRVATLADMEPAELAGLVILDGLDDLLAGVHDEGAVAEDRLADGIGMA